MKPIRVFYSAFNERFYASRAYRMKKTATCKYIVISGEKFDVTDDITKALKEYGIPTRPCSKR